MMSIPGQSLQNSMQLTPISPVLTQDSGTAADSVFGSSYGSQVYPLPGPVGINIDGVSLIYELSPGMARELIAINILQSLNSRIKLGDIVLGINGIPLTVDASTTNINQHLAAATNIIANAGLPKVFTFYSSPTTNTSLGMSMLKLRIDEVPIFLDSLRSAMVHVLPSTSTSTTTNGPRSMMFDVAFTSIDQFRLIMTPYEATFTGPNNETYKVYCGMITECSSSIVQRGDILVSVQGAVMIADPTQSPGGQIHVDLVTSMVNKVPFPKTLKLFRSPGINPMTSSGRISAVDASVIDSVLFAAR